MHIRLNDMVEVITGDDRGQRGKVLAVDLDAGKVIVEGVNRVYKHVRRSQRNPQGGRLSKEMPIPVSNVMLICPQDNKRTRVGFRYLADGSKERYAKRSGVSLGSISPPRKRYATKS
jgi:large subunit ribosomal protein L24